MDTIKSPLIQTLILSRLNLLVSYLYQQTLHLYHYR